MSKFSGRHWLSLASAGAVCALLAGPAAADVIAPHVDGPQTIKYPMEAQRAGEEGTVGIRVYVSDAGKIVRSQLTKSSGIDRLDLAALESVLSWHFKPGTDNGQPVSGWANVQVVYKVPAQQ